MINQAFFIFVSAKLRSLLYLGHHTAVIIWLSIILVIAVWVVAAIWVILVIATVIRGGKKEVGRAQNAILWSKTRQ